MEYRTQQLIRHNLAKIWIVSLLAICLTSCKSYKNSHEFEDVERYNGSSIQQRGSGWLEEDDLPIISGTVKRFGNSKPVDGVQIVFVSRRNDTVVNVLSDQNGRFNANLTTQNFHGNVYVFERLPDLVLFSSSDISIYPFYKKYDINIRIPRQGVFIEEDFKNNPKLRREIKRTIKKREREKRKLKEREQQKQ